ncbi:stalk domain-containing protein [Acetivibrio cellulolyticus]|uniref:stalk domain-containing protein n=1 Tax=Acetivibrio cellulolyticus TaxID=35830 RepID=UPI0001E30120|nr:stalk domain-containing protein [Acetivibrio cellulolyticus]
MKSRNVLSFVLVFLITISAFSFQCFSADSNKLIAHYKFDDDFKDSSGNSLDGEIKGDVPFSEGILGKSAQFGNGYIEVKDNDLLDFSSSFTASMWVKMSPNVDKDNWSGIRTLILKKGNKYSPYYVALYHSKQGMGEFDGNDYNTTRVSSGKEMPLIGEKWCMLTLTFDNGNVSIYQDDKFIKSKAVSDEDKILKKTEGSLFIGNYDGSTNREFYGMIDDLKLYNYALNATDVKTMYEDVMKSASGVIELQINKSKMTVNNVEKEVDPGRNTSPVIVNNRTLVPIRSIIEAMGGNIAWDGNERRVDIILKGKTIKLWIDKTESIVGTEKKALDVAPAIIKERTMLPLRFVTENLGATIEWNDTEKKITIRYTP